MVDALQEERGVGGAELAQEVADVGGCDALADGRGDVLGPGDEQPNDEEQEEGGGSGAAGLGPGRGGWSGGE
jgi:hypothetical protein